MSTRDGALALLLEKLAELEYDLAAVAKQQQAAGNDALHIGASYPHSYFDCASEHRQAATWIEAIREEITACGLLDRLDAEQAELRASETGQRSHLNVVPGGAR